MPWHPPSAMLPCQLQCALLPCLLLAAQAGTMASAPLSAAAPGAPATAVTATGPSAATPAAGAPAAAAVTATGPWETFTQENRRQYASTAEAHRRKRIFEANLATIAAHNGRNESWQMGVGPFTDWTSEEFAATVLVPTSARAGLATRAHMVDDDRFHSAGPPPAAWDWSDKGAVGPVKDQGRCEGCWAFAATGALEGLAKIANGKLQSLSEEQLLACSSSDGNAGCMGGNAVNAFRWVAQKGICTEASYNFTSGGGSVGKCQTTCKPVLSTKGAAPSTANNETALAIAVTINPVAVAIDASNIQNYKSGIFPIKSCSTDLNHNVLAVGYLASGAAPYWRIKNSWGETWGEQGFVRLQMSAVGQRVNSTGCCGVTMFAAYPVGGGVP